MLGQAEQVMFRVGGWQKVRQEQKRVEWLGRVPAFLITAGSGLLHHLRRRGILRADGA